MRGHRKWLIGGLVLVLVAAVAALASLAVASPGKKQAVFKVAWIYPGPHNDGGWSQAHDAGRLYVEKVLGAKVQTTYKENVFSNASVPQIVAGLVRDGYTMIFGTSFGQFELGVNGQLAAKYPKVLFEQATGLQIKPNQAEYFGAGEDSIYLSGMAAGAATKKGTIGYVVPYGIPEVVRHLNAFTLGAQATHRGAKVKIVWTNSWFSPPKETAAAKALASAGADVLGQNVDSPAAGVFAEKQGIPWVGYDSDAKKFAPKQWLTAATYNWGPYYLKRIKAAMAGTWKPGFYYGSIKDGFTDLAPYGPGVTAQTKRSIAAKRAQMIAGKFHAFCGPIWDQQGKLRVAKNKCIDPNTKAGIATLYSMQWLVRGVLGNVSHVLP